MKRSYSIKPNLSTQYSAAAMGAMQTTLAWFKALADQYALQFDITLKTDGIRINVIKKNEDKSIRKRSVECDNDEIDILPRKLQMAVQEILMSSSGLFI